MSDTCQHYDCEHEQCDHAAKPEYGNRYCGVHKSSYYKERIEALEKQIKVLGLQLAKLEQKHRTALLDHEKDESEAEKDKPSASMSFLYAVVTHIAALIVGAAIAYMVVR